jgi:glucosamine 6-phosphate synthetase-like amidotransferase/phosphosugar isomerase protein
LKFTSQGKVIEDEDKQIKARVKSPKREGDEEDSEDDDLLKEQMSQFDYGYREQAYVESEKDCFTMMNAKVDESLKNCDSAITILHSRFAELRRYLNESHGDGLGIIPDHAHPNIDYKDRIALCHNGRIANFDDLLKESREQGIVVSKDDTSKQVTDS